MGNLYAESGLDPQNLQNSYEKKLGHTNASYTQAVDAGTYDNFINDKAGYGLAQWTYWSRKQNLHNFAKDAGKSIGDLQMQLDFLAKELAEGYKGVLEALRTATSVREASDCVLTKFERPADQSEKVQIKRAEYGQTYFGKYATKGMEDNDMGYTNSTLVDCKVMSPNHSGKRTHRIDRITPHCVVGQLKAANIGGCFDEASRKASCNYGIGSDGRVCLVVDEANRSWCSSSSANDQRAITIECASDKTAPYAMTDIVYNKLVELCVDICRRNGKDTLLWFANKDKSLNYEPKDNEMVITVHRWFANKSCPGDWLYARLGNLATTVTAKLSGTKTTDSEKTKTADVTTEAVSGTLEVIYTGTDGVEVHNTPDFNASSCNKTHGPVGPATKKGSKFTVAALVTLAGGSKMYKLKSGLYITASEKYVKFTKTETKTESNVPFKVRVDITDLNIRTGAGTNYAKTGEKTGKGVFTITEVKEGKGSDAGWGRLKSGAGWISLDYATRI
ncbi:phage tail tip lysozyme [Lacrimispora defluvii]|uniref:N-acetylmuramoyl-L-alanine amidase n=1 Tax=Lacrimispora defluvii TaxID=2719233 RepID=A0ABX1VK63_9FIRM|nr:phage tail tip lysozyme [Lacrimispora defluvii]NNJ28679.1 N-acetylmuramoyl-L-alanine amidase [Lacrimispora defluvii]